MKKHLFPFLAAALLLGGAGSALVGCKDATADAIKVSLDRQNKVRAVDDSIIRAYLGRKNYSPTQYTRAADGIYTIIVRSNPQGTPSGPLKVVSVRYEGRLVQQNLEDIIFDTSYNGRTLCNCSQFRVDDPNPDTRAVAGLNEALKTMRVGDQKIILVPSYLAYQNNFRGIIAPNTPLLFDIEVLAVTQ